MMSRDEQRESDIVPHQRLVEQVVDERIAKSVQTYVWELAPGTLLDSQPLGYNQYQGGGQAQSGDVFDAQYLPNPESERDVASFHGWAIPPLWDDLAGRSAHVVVASDIYIPAQSGGRVRSWNLALSHLHLQSGEGTRPGDFSNGISLTQIAGVGFDSGDTRTLKYWASAGIVTPSEAWEVDEGGPFLLASRYLPDDASLDENGYPITNVVTDPVAKHVFPYLNSFVVTGDTNLIVLDAPDEERPVINTFRMTLLVGP